MSAGGDGMASQTLEVTRHGQDPLLDLFLAPMMGSLTFAEVADYVLNENWRRAESSLDDLGGHRAQICWELDNLIKAHGEESDKSSQKRIKKEIDMRQKDFKSLRVAISHLTSNKTNWRISPLGMMACLTMVPGRLLRLRWLLPHKPMMLLQ